MKLLRYGAAGEERPGLLDFEGKLRDLSGHIGDVAGSILLPEQLESLRKIDPGSLPIVEGSPRMGPCIGRVGKLVCVGLNYRAHATEAKMEEPPEPILFMKATSSISGPNDVVVLPPGSGKTDWEVELGVVIGKPGKFISESNAFDHVAGYCIVNDISERAYQLERNGQWVKGKSCDTFAPVGPWLVTSDEIEDPQKLDLWLEVDGHRRQDASTQLMIFSVGYLISYISQFMSLQSGDIIATGTPAGVGHGQNPPIYLRPGQIMRLGVTGLGIQRQCVGTA